MAIRRTDPLRRTTLREAVEQLIDEMMAGRTPFWWRRGLAEEQYIPVNMFELPEGLMIVAPMPGLQADDVELTLSGNILKLRGRRTPGQEDRDYMVKEWDYGPYIRTLELPFPVDTNHMIATLENGILTVNLRKSEAVMPKRISIRTADQRSPTGGESHHSVQ